MTKKFSVTDGDLLEVYDKIWEELSENRSILLKQYNDLKTLIR